MHRIYLPTRKDTRYPYSSIAYLYSSEYVDKVKTQHALSGTCARFIQETHTHTHTHTSGDVTHSLESFPTLQSWKCSDWSVSGMSSFSLAPSCGDVEGDDTAVKPSSTLRILNFFISPRCERLRGTGAPSRDQPWMMKENAALARFCSTSL